MENTAKINNKKGFSILEIPIAMMILTVGLLFLFGVFPTSFSGVSQGKNILGGAQVAEQLFEQAQNSSFSTPQSKTDPNFSITSTLNGVSSTTTYTYTVLETAYHVNDCATPSASGTSTCGPPATSAQLQYALTKDIEVLVSENNNSSRLYWYVTRIAR